MKILSYDLARYDFPAAVREMLGVDDLSTLTIGTAANPEHSIYKNMEQTPLYTRLAEALRGEGSARFRRTYRDFVAGEVQPRYSEPILYQACPTLRIIFADAEGVSRFHRDRDYGHDAREVNYTVALSDAFETNAIWIESKEGAEDYAPITLRPGEYARFDGASLSHGAVANRTGRSRVSFDFRITPASQRGTQAIVDASEAGPPDPHAFARVDAVDA